MDNNKDVTIKPVRANMGIRDDYAKSLHYEAFKMNKDTQARLIEAYKSLPEYGHQETSARQQSDDKKYWSIALLILLGKLSEEWSNEFESFASKKAQDVVFQIQEHTNRTIANKLKAKNNRFDFVGKAELNENTKVLISENVKLIKSIQEKYFANVQSLLTEAIVNDKNSSWLTKKMQENYGITRRRAKMIARDQITKINAATVLAKQNELGIKEAIWRHTNRAKVPRPKHVAASGEKYRIDKGMLIEGEYIYPGQKINCMCVSEWVIPKL